VGSYSPIDYGKSVIEEDSNVPRRTHGTYEESIVQTKTFVNPNFAAPRAAMEVPFIFLGRLPARVTN
jgi:hypothetical protein